jgi:hypothetical protein
VLTQTPTALWPSRQVQIGCVAAFGEAGVEFSYALDGAAWSDWSNINSYTWTGVSDANHVLRVRARDRDYNVERSPANWVFEVDATPPSPVLAFPTFGLAVRDSILIRGTAADERFKAYRVEYRPTGTMDWNLLTESFDQVAEGVLCGWNTTSLKEGDYDVRLVVSDTLGLTGAAAIRVVVDNQAPWANETAPAVVSAAAGGSIYTTDEEVHLYFPPWAFAGDTEVTIVPAAWDGAPDTLENGARRVLSGYQVSWGSASLEKAATLDMSYATPGALGVPMDGTPALYVFGVDSTWQRLGGTLDASGKHISCAINEAGQYAIYAEAGGIPGSSTLSEVIVTPRVFSPAGVFASDEAAISFSLGRPGPVTVKVYNRAGRLVRAVVSGRQMSAGANLIRWDGRDSYTNLAEDGLYLVVVEALGQRQVKTLAVVR